MSSFRLPPRTRNVALSSFVATSRTTQNPFWLEPSAGTRRVTLGLCIGIPDDADWVQEKTMAQGMVNLRWPFARLNWVRTDQRFGSVHFASYTTCSFVKDGTLYQIGRIMPTRLSASSASSKDACDDLKQRKFIVDAGGVIRFGCPSSAANRRDNDLGRTPVPPPFYDRYSCTPNDGQPAYVFTCTSDVHEKRLEIRVWVDREPIKLGLHKCESPRLHNGCHPEDYPDEVLQPTCQA
jgi:hypothetical protein